MTISTTPSSCSGYPLSTKIHQKLPQGRSQMKIIHYIPYVAVIYSAMDLKVDNLPIKSTHISHVKLSISILISICKCYTDWLQCHKNYKAHFKMQSNIVKCSPLPPPLRTSPYCMLSVLFYYLLTLFDIRYITARSLPYILNRVIALYINYRPERFFFVGLLG